MRAAQFAVRISRSVGPTNAAAVRTRWMSTGAAAVQEVQKVIIEVIKLSDGSLMDNSVAELLLVYS
jgi:hypothetical protein